MTDLATGNMALLALAPNGIAQLRSLIMDLAVRGRLIAQQEDDAPAVEAIACIDRAKRARLTKAELARLDALATAPIDEQPFDLPASWLWRRLGAIGVVASSSRVHQKDWTTEGIPFYRTREIVQLSHRGSVTPDLFISEALFDELVARSPGPAAGDIMITGVGTIGVPYVVRASDKFYFKDASVLIFKNHFGFSPDYLALFFKSPWWRETIHKESMGTTVHTLTIGRANEVLVPIPPLAEQHRIVAKVDELMALCDRLEARQQDAEAAHARLVQALLDSLTQARDADEFQACWQRVAGQLELVLTTNESVDAVKQAVLRLAFSGRLLGGTLVRTGEPQTALPDGWRELQLADIAVVGTGATPARTNPAYFDPPEFPWVTSGETSAALINATAQRVSAQALAETNLTIYPPGTLVVAMYGQGKTRGQVSELAIEACTNQACAAIQLKDPSPAHRQYVKYFFEKSYDELRELAAGGAQPNLNLGKIKSTLIPLPPLEEQRRIVAKVTELLALCDQLKARISAARAKYAQLAEALVAQAVA